MNGLFAYLAKTVSVLVLVLQLGEVYSAETVYPFATFTTSEVDIDIEDGEIELTAAFTLAQGSNGIDPAKEPVSLHVKGGTAVYSVTIPVGSFKMAQNGAFNFLGTLNGVRIIASIRPARPGAFDFEIVTERAKLKGIANPVTVNLAIGDDGGSRMVRAKIE